MSVLTTIKKVLTTPIGGSGRKKGLPQEEEDQQPVPSVHAVVSGAGGAPTIPADAVVNALEDGVLALDRFGNILLANPAALRLAGFNSANNPAGLNYSEVIKLFDGADNEVADNDNPIRAALVGNMNFSSRSLKLSNRERNIKLPVALHVYYSQADDAIIVVYSDISDEVNNNHNQLSFIATASHEMRTPAAIIEGYLSIALDPSSATLDERARDYITKAHDTVIHLGALSGQLLDVTKLAEHQMTPRFQAVEVGELLTDITNRAVLLAKQKGIALSYDPSPMSLGSQTRIKQLIYAKIDPDFLRAIINQLLENAFKYTPSGGRVDILAEGNEHDVIVTVRDTGVGIPAEDLPHIFQKFYRAGKTNTGGQKGSGWGLFIAAQRAEALGGKLYAESKVGQGSSFYLRFTRISEQRYQEERAAVPRAYSAMHKTENTQGNQR